MRIVDCGVEDGCRFDVDVIKYLLSVACRCLCVEKFRKSVNIQNAQNEGSICILHFALRGFMLSTVK